MQKRQVVKHTATWDPSQAGAQYDPSQNANRDYANGAEGSYNEFIHGKYVGTGTIGPSVWSAMNGTMGGRSPGAGLGSFAAPGKGYGQSSVTTPESAKAIEQLGEDGVTVGKPGNPGKEVLRAIRSNEKQIANHVQKIKDYMRDPFGHDNKGFLRNAKSADEVERLIQARITELEKQILKIINENDKLRSRL